MWLHLLKTAYLSRRHAAVSAKASSRQVGFLDFWRRFAPGGAVAVLASARVGVALVKPPAMTKRARVLKINTKQKPNQIDV